MNLITIEVLCPAVSDSFDFRFPVKMKAEDLKNRLVDDIRTFENNQNLFNKGVSVFYDDGCMSPDMTLEDAGVKNGDRIMII